MSKSLDLEFRLDRAKRLSRALSNKGWTRTSLAAKTGYDEKTIRNVLSGDPVRDQTIIDISQALGISPELESEHDHVDVADDVYGGYLRSTHKSYEGYFHIYRRSFSQPGRIFRSIISINWDDVESRLAFMEYYEKDSDRQLGARSHNGAVYISSYTGLVHLLTIFEGSLRLMTLTKLRESDGIMRGSLKTQSESLMFFQPTISSVCLIKIRSYNTAQIPDEIGLLEENAPDYPVAMKQLELTEQQIIKIAF